MDESAPVTREGRLIFFAQFLHAGGKLDQFVTTLACVAFSSNTRPLLSVESFPFPCSHSLLNTHFGSGRAFHFRCREPIRPPVLRDGFAGG
jgi:hypothetical protein